VNVVTAQPIAAGAAVPFQIRVENPPADAVDLEATFASYAEMAFAGGAARVSPTAEHHEELLLDTPAEAAPAAAADPAAAPAAAQSGLRLRNG